MHEPAIRHVNPAEGPPPGGHYSHGTVANGLVFVAGQLPITPQGEKLAQAPFDVQARQVLANVEAVLKACGSGVERLVQVRVYVDDIAHWPAFNAIYAQWAGTARPARAVVPVPGLHHGLKLEVEAVALAPA
ncbi:MAG: RidA family protein [Rubrivivax sp.]|jgi:reactive intermediate/imine deaminase|nr:RidA family protein [Rubrivivax sp.]